MNALRIYTTVRKTRNVSMRMVHFIVIVILGILKTATAAKVISISISTLIIICIPSFLRNSKTRTVIYLFIYLFIYLLVYAEFFVAECPGSR